MRKDQVYSIQYLQIDVSELDQQRLERVFDMLFEAVENEYGNESAE